MTTAEKLANHAILMNSHGPKSTEVRDYLLANQTDLEFLELAATARDLKIALIAEADEIPLEELEAAATIYDNLTRTPMDPTANLKEQLELAQGWETSNQHPDDAQRLAELVIALHDWISKGGFLPAQWTKGKP